MNIIDLLALTPVVIAGTAFGTHAVIKHNGVDNVRLASTAGLWHYKEWSW